MDCSTGLGGLLLVLLLWLLGSLPLTLLLPLWLLLLLLELLIWLPGSLPLILLLLLLLFLLPWLLPLSLLSLPWLLSPPPFLVVCLRRGITRGGGLESLAKGKEKVVSSSTNSEVGRLVVINARSPVPIVLPWRPIRGLGDIGDICVTSEASVAVSLVQSLVCPLSLVDRSVGIRVGGIGESLGLLRTAGSDGDVGVTTGGLLGIDCSPRRRPRCLVIHHT